MYWSVPQWTGLGQWISFKKWRFSFNVFCYMLSGSGTCTTFLPACRSLYPPHDPIHQRLTPCPPGRLEDRKVPAIVLFCDQTGGSQTLCRRSAFILHSYLPLARLRENQQGLMDWRQGLWPSLFQWYRKKQKSDWPPCFLKSDMSILSTVQTSLGC